MTLPLLITVAPRPGESLASLVARVCRANAVERQRDLLELIELRTLRPENVAFTKMEFAHRIADLFSVDRTNLYSRFHSALRTPGMVEWYGTRLPRRFIEAKERRYSPASLRRSGHYREEWNVKALSYCPESFELLRSDCPHCGLRLGWRKTRGITVCEACGISLKRVDVDVVPVSDRPDAGIVAGLISPDPTKRARSMARLPSVFHGSEAGDVFVAAIQMALIFGKQSRGKKSARGRIQRGDFSAFAVDDLLTGFLRMRDWPQCISDAIDQHVKTASPQNLAAPLLRKLSFEAESTVPLAKLVRDEIAAQMLARGVPLGVSRHAAKKFCTDVVVSSQEAVYQHRTSYKMLARLTASSGSNCIRAERPGKYGLKLFDERKLATAMHVRRAALTETDVCSRLDVLPVMLDHLVHLDLLAPVNDQDAVTMARCRLYEAASVKDLGNRLDAVKPSTEIRTRAVDLLRRQFHPLLQSQAIAAVLDGRLATVGRYARGRRLQVDEADATEFAVAQRPPSVPQGEVTFLAAARLLGLHGPFVGIAYKMGLLKGQKLAANLANIPLRSAASFDKAYASSGEISGLLGVHATAVAKLMRQVGARPAVRIMQKALWHRQDAERLRAGTSMGSVE